MLPDPKFEVKFLLRWRFEYHDGRPAKYGMWSNPGNIEKEGAWRVNKEGISAAVVEGQCVYTQKVHRMMECKGEDFVNFEWVNTAAVDLSNLSNIRETLVGLSIVTRDEVATMLINGESLARIRTLEEKKAHLAGFGR